MCYQESRSTFFHKALATAPSLLCRLEEKLHSAFQPLLLGLQQLGTTQQHCHMAVMPACMALSWYLAPAPHPCQSLLATGAKLLSDRCLQASYADVIQGSNLAAMPSCRAHPGVMACSCLNADSRSAAALFETFCHLHIYGFGLAPGSFHKVDCQLVQSCLKSKQMWL